MKWRPHPLLPIPSDEELAVMEPEEIIEYHRQHHEAINKAEADPYRYGFKLPHWAEVERTLQEDDEVLILGGNRCLAPDQLIFDPVTGKKTPVSEITGAFHVWAWDGTKKVVALAEKPFRKPQSEIFRVVLDNGEALDCSAAHLLLTPGGWKPLGSLSPGDSLVSALGAYSPAPAPSTLELFRREFRQGVARWIGKAQDSLARCFEGCRRYDAPLPKVPGFALVFAPSQGDAPTRKRAFCSIPHSLSDDVLRFSQRASGDRDGKLSSSLYGRQSCRRSTQGAPDQNEDRDVGIQSRVFCTPCELASYQFQSGGQSSPASFLPIPNPGFVQRGNQCACDLPCREDELFAPRVKIKEIYLLRTDWVWDFTVPRFHNYICAGVVSHNSGKTEFSAWAVVKAAVENPSSEIFCFAQNAKISIRQQQKAVWRYLPAEFKRKINGAVANVSYTQKNGFTDGSLILPNGSQIVFVTYSQFQQDDTILEGAELGSKDPKWLNVGVWLDEYLSGPALIETIRNRLATRDSKLLTTFTPLKGWTEVVRSYLEGARTVKEAPAELLNGELVPLLQKCRHRNAHVHYFHSENNPFGGYDRIKRNLAGKDKATVLVRAYGVPTKSFTTVFPKFSTTVNVIKPEDIPTKDVTRYHIIDPAGRKNWFMTWIAVDAYNCWYIYREWPGVDVGDWAEPDEDGGWKPGEGSRGQGFGLRTYIETIYELEGRKYDANRDVWTGGEEITERLIDPRLAAAKYQREDGDSCIIDDLNELDFIVIPAPGDHIEDGLQKLVDRMDYDPGKPIDFTNRPLLYISEECENTISAFGNYTGAGGKDEAWKDPIDCPRYAAAAGIEYFPETTFQAARIGAGGY